MEVIVSVVAILASLTAVAAFAMTVTKTPRLARRASTLRDAIGAVEPNSTQQEILKQMHLEVSAELVARQLTPAWRSLWPWLAWAAFAGTAAQSGYQTVRYLVDTEGFDYTDYSIAAFGDTTVPILGAVTVFGILPVLSGSYLTTVLSRAEVALNFFEGNAVDRPKTYMEMSSRAFASSAERGKGSPTPSSGEETTGVWRRLRLILQLAAPGVFFIILGFFIGTLIAMKTIEPEHFVGSDEKRRTLVLDQLGALPGYLAIVLAVTGGLTLWAVSTFLATANESKLPSHYPQS